MPEEPKPTDGKPNNEPSGGGGEPSKPTEPAGSAGGNEPPADGGTKATETPPAGGPPEKYETFTVPEGVELDAEVLKDFEAAARDMGLTQGNAQKLVDFGVKLVESGVEQADEVRTNTLKTWEEEIKADPEFGGDKLEETLDRGRRVMRNHGSDALRELIEVTGLGSNPHLLRFLAKLDKALGEDRTVDGKPAPSEKKTAGEVLYDGK